MDPLQRSQSMPHSRSRSQSALRASLVCCTLAAIALLFQACSSKATVNPNVPPACRGYENDPDVYGYCITLNIRSIWAPNAALSACSEAGSWKSVCQEEWMEVMANHSKADLNSLLTLCPSDDCRLVLEARSQKDVLDQLALCPKAGKFERDCEGHALQRWALNKPFDMKLPWSFISKTSIEYAPLVNLSGFQAGKGR
jgi:hypothetical protein